MSIVSPPFLLLIQARQSPFCSPGIPVGPVWRVALTAGGSPVGSPGAGAVGDGAVGQVAVPVVGRSTGDNRGTVLEGTQVSHSGQQQQQLNPLHINPPNIQLFL